MTIYTLYIKTHNVTGLKYLGQTTKDALTYKGSGIDWKIHLKEWGNNVTTEILYQGDDRTEMKRLGRHYSDLWNVKSSNEWANRIPETGGGSAPSEATRQILREKQLGRKKPPRTKEHRKNLSEATKGISKTRTQEHQSALTASIKQNWKTNNERKEQVRALGKSNKGKTQSSETLEKKRLAMKAYWDTKRKNQKSNSPTISE